MKKVHIFSFWNDLFLATLRFSISFSIMLILRKILPYLWIEKLTDLGFIYFGARFLIELFLSYPNYKRFRYQLKTDFLYIERGFIIHHKIITPLKKVQHIEIKHTMISRLFNKSSLIIFTASGNRVIEYLTEKDAIDLRNQIEDFLKKEVDSDGSIGDGS